MEVTKEDVSDGKMLKPLIQQQQQQQQQNITRVIADGTYDFKDNFSYLDSLGIKPIIKVRKNSSYKTNNNNCIPRKLVVVEQLKDVKMEEEIQIRNALDSRISIFFYKKNIW
jgi:Transposase DDE domain